VFYIKKIKDFEDKKFYPVPRNYTFIDFHSSMELWKSKINDHTTSINGLTDAAEYVNELGSMMRFMLDTLTLTNEQIASNLTSPNYEIRNNAEQIVLFRELIRRNLGVSLPNKNDNNSKD
jgi:hypothetical protein